MGKVLLKGGTVLSVDPDVGDLQSGDVLIEDDRIAGVEASIDADAEIVNCADKIVIPGFVDSHRHTWEAAIRNCAPNATLDDYFVDILDTFAPLYRAEDVYASNVAGSLECLNAGITTLVDWSHINNTPSTLTPRFGACRRLGSGPSMRTAVPTRRWRSTGSSVRRPSRATMSAGSRIPISPLPTACSPWLWPPAARASPRTRWSSPSGACTRARHPAHCPRRDGPDGRPVRDGGAAGPARLLGPDTTFIHCCFSEHEWKRVADTGGTISSPPRSSCRWATAGRR